MAQKFEIFVQQGALEDGTPRVGLHLSRDDTYAFDRLWGLPFILEVDADAYAQVKASGKGLILSTKEYWKWRERQDKLAEVRGMAPRLERAFEQGGMSEFVRCLKPETRKAIYEALGKTAGTWEKEGDYVWRRRGPSGLGVCLVIRNSVVGAYVAEVGSLQDGWVGPCPYATPEEAMTACDEELRKRGYLLG